MKLTEAAKLTRTCADRMNALYGGVVFDEWAIVQITGNKGHTLSYDGPRNAEFQRNFLTDLASLSTELFSAQHGNGDFEFAPDGAGTRFEAFMVMGPGLFLICNNTRGSIADVRRNPLWIKAQAPFVALSDKVRASPVELSR